MDLLNARQGNKIISSIITSNQHVIGRLDSIDHEISQTTVHLASVSNIEPKLNDINDNIDNLSASMDLINLNMESYKTETIDAMRSEISNTLGSGPVQSQAADIAQIQRDMQ